VFDNRSVDSFYDKPSWSIPSKWVDKKYYSNEFGMPSNNYYHLPETKRLINQYLKEAGEKGITGNAAIEYARSFINPSVECMEIPDNAYADGATALEAKDIMIQLSKKNEPFFFAVGFLKPHLPFVSPKKYWDLYQRDDLPVSEHQQPSINGPLIAYHNSSESWTYTDILALLPKIKPTYGIGLPIEKQKELIHGYYAAVSYTDAQVGKLLNALDSLGLGDNTIIVLWGDHGWHLGDHDMWCKHSNFEQATRSPLIIAAPGIKPSKTKSVSEFVDIFPTLCDLTGIEIPAKLDGVSLVPLMKTPSLTVKEFAVSQYTRGANVMGYSIRTDRYRYTIWIDHNFRSTMPFNPDWLVGTELYDYTVDPEETVNVNNEEIYASVSKELNKQMMQFLNSQVKDNGTTRVYDNKDNPVTRHIFQDTNSEIINLSYTSVNNGKVLVKIMTLNSNVVKTFNSTKTDKRFESQINIADLNTGIYLIEVQENGVRLFCDKIVRL
jgi:arylsulfatase A-like enzyme